MEEKIPGKYMTRFCELHNIYQRNRDSVTLSGYYWEFQENVWYLIARYLFQVVFATFNLILEFCTTLNEEQLNLLLECNVNSLWEKMEEEVSKDM